MQRNFQVQEKILSHVSLNLTAILTLCWAELAAIFSAKSLIFGKARNSTYSVEHLIRGGHDTKHNGTQHNETQHKGLISATQHKIQRK